MPVVDMNNFLMEKQTLISISTTAVFPVEMLSTPSMPANEVSHPQTQEVSVTKTLSP
jgi:hypothetical protein